MNLGSSRDVSILCAFDRILSKHAVEEDDDESGTGGLMVGGDGGDDGGGAEVGN
jgi:hypothetical protein